MNTLLCGKQLVIALGDHFISCSPCELAIYYHIPLTKEETENTENVTNLPQITGSKWQH